MNRITNPHDTIKEMIETDQLLLSAVKELTLIVQGYSERIQNLETKFKTFKHCNDCSADTRDLCLCETN